MKIHKLLLAALLAAGGVAFAQTPAAAPAATPAVTPAAPSKAKAAPHKMQHKAAAHKKAWHKAGAHEMPMSEAGQMKAREERMSAAYEDFKSGRPEQTPTAMHRETMKHGARKGGMHRPMQMREDKKAEGAK
ncbi:MAG: hypothetical protein OJF60_002846 [Burkholderiaceae bacterium]|jgi:hypothetical protein|nr:MAG: hypothetical protein OJF60_002846 [Burkholderiaceae bacterium]